MVLRVAAVSLGLIAQQMSLDQGRWSEINSQLDQLERTLTVKQ